MSARMQLLSVWKCAMMGMQVRLSCGVGFLLVIYILDLERALTPYNPSYTKSNSKTENGEEQQRRPVFSVISNEGLKLKIVKKLITTPSSSNSRLRTKDNRKRREEAKKP